MNRFFLAICIAFALLVTPAFGADNPSAKGPQYDQRAPTASYNWSGLYAGADAGAQWASDSTDYTDPGSVVPFFSGKVRGTEAVFGGFAGYNWQIGKLVFGPEVSFGAGGKSDLTSSFGETAECHLDVQWESYLCGRVGYAVDHWRIFFAGGAVVADLKYQEGPLGGPLLSHKNTRWGWTVGGGVEYALTTNWLGRAEYRYADYGSADYSLLPYFHTIASHHLTENEVLVGIAYKF